jgi:hypothetical protein
LGDVLENYEFPSKLLEDKSEDARVLGFGRKTSWKTIQQTRELRETAWKTQIHYSK